MTSAKNLLSVIKELSFKTLYFNFRYLPFKQAIRLPIFLSKNVYLMHAGGKININFPVRSRSIRIGYKGVGIFDHEHSRTIWNVYGNVTFKGKANIGHGSKISVGENGQLILGNNFTITAETSLITTERKIQFGSNCLISWETLVMDSDFHKIYNDKREIINSPKDISIGNDVWIGCRCLILKGSTIPNNSIIAANSLVNKALFGEYKSFGGQPAKELKDKLEWAP